LKSVLIRFGPVLLHTSIGNLIVLGWDNATNQSLILNCVVLVNQVYNPISISLLNIDYVPGNVLVNGIQIIHPSSIFILFAFLLPVLTNFFWLQ
jgi:hypothetical protein